MDNRIFVKAHIMSKGPNLNGDIFTDQAMQQIIDTAEGLDIKLGLASDAPVIGKVRGCSRTKDGISVLAHVDGLKIGDVAKKDFIGWCIGVDKVECSKCHGVFAANVINKCDCIKAGDGKQICDDIKPKFFIYHRDTNPADLKSSIEITEDPGESEKDSQDPLTK